MASVHSASRLRELFDARAALTVGLEEEVMLLDPGTLDLAPAGPDVVRDLSDARFKVELPASQIEIVTAPVSTVPEAIAQLAAARRHLAATVAGRALPAAAGMHPFAPAEGALSPGDRYAEIERRYGAVARRQLVCALQVHVAVGSADATLAVYNALRSYLPLLAALAANAPFHEGADTGVASWRAVTGRLLPRQGVPPAIASWEQFAADLDYAGDHTQWWWELRPHVIHGTLELRVPDAQTTVPEAAGVAALTQALVARLAERHSTGETFVPEPTWRIEERRWSACRYGVEGMMDGMPTRDRLSELIDELEPVAGRLGCARELAGARQLAQRNGAMRLRELGAQAGTRMLADDFLAGVV